MSMKLDEDLQRQVDMARPRLCVKKEIAKLVAALVRVGGEIERLELEKAEAEENTGNVLSGLASGCGDVSATCDAYGDAEKIHKESVAAHERWRMEYEPAKKRYDEALARIKAAKNDPSVLMHEPTPRNPDKNLPEPKIKDIPQELASAYASFYDKVERETVHIQKAVFELVDVSGRLEAKRVERAQVLAALKKALQERYSEEAKFTAVLAGAEAEMERRKAEMAKRIAEMRAELDADAKRYGLN